MPPKRTIFTEGKAPACLMLLLVATLLSTSACHRGYYRRQADAEATKLISEKASDPHWDLPDRTIDIDPRSRMAHPFSSDHPPMPPDDPAAHEFMLRVDNKPGFPHWGANGELDQVENPEWMSFVPVNERGELVLDTNRAVQVAYLHSPLYQAQRETLYQSALDVSLERFAFDAQLFASYNSFLTADGRIRGGGNSRTTLEAGTGPRGVALRKLGITGSTLVVGMANTMLWQFAGPTTTANNSLIDFSFVQPLLRGGGRERFLEALTFAERNLLANVRQMERFRRGFYLNIVTGRNPGQGPIRGGSFLGSPGSQPLGVGGVLGLLEDRQSIFIQEYNVTQLRYALDRFKMLLGAQRISALQVTQIESQLYQAQQQLFNLTNNYEASLDFFKINLGLPPEMKIVIEDPLLDQFQLIDPRAIRQQDQLNRLREEISLPIGQVADIVFERSLNSQGLPVEPADEPVAFAWGDDVTELLRVIHNHVTVVDEVRRSVTLNQMGAVLADIEKLRANRDQRVRNLAKLQSINMGYGLLDDPENEVLADELISDQAVANPELLQAGVEEIVKRLETRTDRDLRQVAANIEALLENHSDDPETKERLVEGVLEPLPQILADITGDSLELLLIQVVARTDIVELPEVILDPDVAIQIAKHFRRDWMNARASLVDAWRLIEFQADQLESSFDLVFEGDIGNVGDNPLNFRTANARARMGFRFDSPITRLQERNNYRAALIRYQQARRQYYQFRDEIARNLRQILRQIELGKVLFELNRLQVKVNAVQVEQANFEVSRPAPPGVRGGSSTTLGRDLTDAINRLQQAQRSFLSSWVGFESLRRGLDFDLGTMQLDDDGLWIDPGPINQDYVERLIQEDQRLLEDLGGLEWFDSREEFLDQTGLKLPPPAVVRAPAANDPPSSEEQAIDQLRRQLRSELSRASDRRPAHSSSTPVSHRSFGQARAQRADRAEVEDAANLAGPANSAADRSRTMPPVDVSTAFPSLPQPDPRSPSPRQASHLPWELPSPPQADSSVSPAAAPDNQRFRPILPQ